MAYTNTTLVQGFNVNAAIPLDVKTHKDTLAERNAIPAGQRYLGMPVYVIAENKSYRLIGGLLDANWVEVKTGGGGVQSVPNQTARDAIPMDDRYLGFIAYVQDEEQYYYLKDDTDNDGWQPFRVGGGGALVVPDYGSMLAIPAQDRFESMFVYTQDEDELWQLRNGIADSNWFCIDDIGKIITSGAVQTLSNNQPATLLANQQRQKILVKGDTPGADVDFVLPNPTLPNQELIIQGGSDSSTCTLRNKYVNGAVTGNFVNSDQGDVTFTLFKTLYLVADSNLWVAVGR